MVAPNPLDVISMLPDFLLILIISCLPFKEALRTSVLSRRWRELYREVRNISFNEVQILRTYDNIEDQQTKRARFVQYMINWVSNYAGGVIESFELSFSRPVGFEAEMQVLIEFAAIRKVKNLLLDFSERRWANREAVERGEAENMIQMPESFYRVTTLVTLKLLACRFDPSKLAEAGSIERLYFGWMQVMLIMPLLSKTPLLESLHIKNCWQVGLEAITGYNNRLSRLVFKNCGFAVQSSTLELPNVEVFKYSGKVHRFGFKNVNERLDEVSLDFRQERSYHDGLGTQLCDLLSSLSSAKTLMVCPFLLQVIQVRNQLKRVKVDMEARQMVLMANLEPQEFIGISYMINSCPFLETLTFQLLVSRPVQMAAPEVDPDTYWMLTITQHYFTRYETLKNVEIWNFGAGTHELQVLKYLIGLCRELERVDLYMPLGHSESQMESIRAAAELVGETFDRASDRLTVYLHESMF
ncbi:hypothetical protein CARUB_v10024741mg [Capsella rubella]|uniref:F-box domain-containing protein n=1 Tax=Capsella rubella TaxID=81985 RepID=R0HT38_9BRAS|nr:F-box protein At3g62230 [Capsella rubella]EOA28525.1 hypothetical protein CARUB_v10024741mg [Capsella rubella]